MVPLVYPRPPVVLESPLKGNYFRNMRYLKAAMRDSIFTHGEAPFASHAIYPFCMDDRSIEERSIGMEMGFVWGALAKTCVVYEDLGITEGMQKGISLWVSRGLEVEYRRIGLGWDFGPSLLAAPQITCRGCSRHVVDEDMKSWCDNGNQDERKPISPVYRSDGVPSWCPGLIGTKERR